MKVYASKEYVEEKWIERRIAWVEDDGMVEILSEIELVQEDESGDIEAGIDHPLNLEVGKTYTVIFNGVEYKCVAQDATAVMGAECAFLGDGSGVGLSGNGEPFMVISTSVEVEPGIYGAVLGHEVGTISIYGGSETIHTVEPKFLPGGVPYVLEDQIETIFAEQSIQLTNNMYMEYSLLPFVLGETYTVTWDGVAYKCDCITATFDGMDTIGLGNASIYGGGEDTGEPFAVGVIASQGVSGFIAADNDSHTVSITGKTTKIQKLDNRCLDLDWYAAPDEEVIMEPTVFSFESGMARTTGFDYSTVPVVEGGYYRIYLDGVKYDTICRLVRDETDLAARSYVLFNESHFVEVRYAVELGWLMVYLISGASGPHTVAITQKIYNPISIEYIPDCVLTKDNTNWLAKKEENVTVIDEWINALGRSDLTTDTVKCYLSNRSKASLDSTLFSPNKCYRLDIEQGSRYVFDVQKTVRYAGSKTTTHRSASSYTSDVEAEVYYFTTTGEMPDMDNIDLSLLPIYEYVVPLDATYANMWLYLPMDCEIDTTQSGICYRFVEVETTYNALPEEYFPEEIGSFVMRSSTEGSTKKFRVTIDDTGAFVSTEITE